MMRQFSVAIGMMTLLAGMAAADDAMVFKVQVNPNLQGTSNHVVGTNAGNNDALANTNRQEQRQFVVSSTEQFPGSYFVEKGNYYFQAPKSRNGVRPEIIKTGSCSHVQDLAGRLKYEAQTICTDLADKYRDKPNYSEAYCEAYHVWQLADQIAASESAADKSALASTARDLDSSFQPVRRDVREWSQGQQGDRALQAKVDLAEALIQHLRNDVGATPPDPLVARAGTAVLLHDESPRQSDHATPNAISFR